MHAQKLLIISPFLALTACLGSPRVYAQAACPAGFESVAAADPSHTHCVPEASQQSQSTSHWRWLSRYGAIAGSSNTIFGYAKDERSRGAARKSAIQDCKDKGGIDCSLDIEYSNQCAAVVGGNFSYATARGPSEDSAIAFARGICKKRNEACAVKYINCTDAVPTM